MELIGYDGGDDRVVRAARVSTKDGDMGGQKRLIRYLYNNGHWSPFEHTTFTFRSELPIFLARQVMRHKSQAFNEMSMRYSEALPHFHLPDTYHHQSGTMKQGRADTALADHLNKQLRDKVMAGYAQSWGLYQYMLELNVSREQAREHLPVATYTVLYTTASLRSLIHFLAERDERSAQLEVQRYAQNIREAIKDVVPITLEVASE